MLNNKLAKVLGLVFCVNCGIYATGGTPEIERTILREARPFFSDTGSSSTEEIATGSGEISYGLPGNNLVICIDGNPLL
jgi:hypothetical protein